MLSGGNNNGFSHPTMLKPGYTGDRMVPFRGTSNRFESNFEASLNYSDSQKICQIQNPQNIESEQRNDNAADIQTSQKNNHQFHQALLFSVQHQISTRKLMHSFNFSGNKWSPEDEEMALLLEQEISNAKLQQQIQSQDATGNKKMLNKPMILHFSQFKSPPMILTMFEDIQDLNSIRYKEVRRLQLREKLRQKMQHVPYEYFVALDARDISNQAHHIFHWGANGVCAIGLNQNVYLCPLHEPDSTTQIIEACKEPFIVTSVRWMNPLKESSLPLSQSCCVLALSTNCPECIIQLWEYNSLRVLRRINKTQELISSLDWNNHLLVTATTRGSLIINDVRIKESEVLKIKVFGIGPINHCAFSSDGKYLAICGNCVQIYTINNHEDPNSYEGVSYSYERIMNVGQTSKDPINQIAWSFKNPQLFAFALIQDKNDMNSSQSRYSELQQNQDETYLNQIVLYHVDKQRKVGSINLQQRPAALLFSKNLESSTSTSYVLTQRLFAGLSNGNIAIISLYGNDLISAQVTHNLLLHSQQVMFLQESPDGRFLGSIAEDGLVFVWRHNPYQVQNDIEQANGQQNRNNALRMKAEENSNTTLNFSMLR